MNMTSASEMQVEVEFAALHHCLGQHCYLDAFSTGNFVQRFTGRLEGEAISHNRFHLNPS